MTPPVIIRLIRPGETRPLRQLVLRPHQKAEDLVYPGDDNDDTRHFGAFAGDRLMGVASLYHEPTSGSSESGTYRLRGMAVVPEMQRLGYGSRLLDACVASVKEKGGHLIWCNARVGAVPFYRRHQFETEGDSFDLPGIGPHFLMKREV